MNILLTNDDGIDAKGILELESALKQFGNVYVVAPNECQSGKACAITAFKGVKIKRIDDNHIQVFGTPVDCVEVACAFYDVKFDLVVSGCNEGFNLGNDIMYSGTCGACIQSTFSNLKSIAFSCQNKFYFDNIKKFVPEVINFVLKNNLLSTEYYLNVNLPSVDKHKGIKITKIFSPIVERYFLREINVENDTYIIDREVLSNNNLEDSDYNSVMNGYISITPLSQNTFKKCFYNQVLEKINKGSD